MWPPQELKGNIRVYCRVRPPLPEEASADTVDMAFAEGEDRSTVTLTAASASCLGESRGAGRRRDAFPFEFDRVYGPRASQEAVFRDVEELVQSALDGHKV